MNRLLTNYCEADLLCCHSLRKFDVALLRLTPSLICAVHLGLLATFLSSLRKDISFLREQFFSCYLAT